MYETHGISVVRSCQTVGLARSAYDQTPVDGQVRDVEVIEALNEFVDSHRRGGVWQLVDRLLALGNTWNHKQIDRVYPQLELNRSRLMKRRVAPRASVLGLPKTPIEEWPTDFMIDALYHGTSFCTCSNGPNKILR